MKHKKHKSEKRNEEEGEEKPHLKIVLKLGGEGVYDSDYAASSPASFAGDYSVESEKTHKKKKKKKRHTSDEQPELHPLKIKTKFRKEYEESLIDEVSASEAPLSVATLPTSPFSDNVSFSSPNPAHSPAVERTEEPAVRKKSVVVTEQMKKALKKLLEHLLRQLERKDPHEIFAWPVNDLIAPGYSELIDRPMDFSTIRKKINQNNYSSVNEFKEDFKLMTDNCCKYNRPDTVFYEVGKKLLNAGMKIMSKDRLLSMKRSLNFLHDLTKAECAYIMGLAIEIDDTEENMTLDVEDVEAEAMSVADDDSSTKPEGPTEKSDSDQRAHADAISFTDADNEETVAPDVLRAAKQARERLAQRCPKSKTGFLRIDDTGKTTFNFLNPDVYEEQSQVVDLGTLTGRLSSGINTFPDAREDKRNRVTPLSYLSSGPFGSFSPTYDSRVANITREESDLLLSTYGGDTEYLFAKSMHNFVKDASLDMVHMVDDLLDTLTHGAHKRALQSIESSRKVEEEQAKQASQVDKVAARIKQEADVILTVPGNAVDANPIQQKLDRAGELVVKLEQTQNERLSEQPPSGQPNLRGPSDQENAIAAELRDELTDLMQHAKPEQISSIVGVRKAMGIEIQPTSDTVSTNP